MFTPNDISQIEARGLSLADVEKQIENFRNGFPALPVVRAAAGGDGVKQLDVETVAEREAYYTDNLKNIKTIKFVPASGAATRMFKLIDDFKTIDI